MKRLRIFRLCLAGLILAGVIVSEGCKKSPSPVPASVAPPSDIDPVHGHLLHAQPKLPTIKIWLGDQELTAEVARRPVEIATGMMFRTNVPEDAAMIFVFPHPGQQNFYMRNCSVPMSGAYISPEGEILEIIQMKALDETGILSKSANVQFVLETAQGWFDRHHVQAGTVVRTEQGSLKDTFFGNGRGAAK